MSIVQDYLNNHPDIEKAISNRKLTISNKTLPLEIIIKPEALDTSSLHDNNSKKLWRPSKFEEYIGQNNLKNILKGYISGTKELNISFPHMMIDGKAGMGKTTIAYLLSKYLDLNFVECVATTLQSQQQLVDLISESKGGIVFIDEIHMLNKKLANFILPILEDFQISGQRIKPFTLFACTTEKGILLKKYKPLVDRMKIQYTLQDYNHNELKYLIQQFKQKTYPTKKVEERVYDLIAKNCRGTPRIAIRYLESYIFMNIPIEKVFKSYNIIKDSITTEDIKVLKLLAEKEKGIGLKSICAFLSTSEENYLYSIEGYLIQQGLMTITTRRCITDKGRRFLNEL